MKSYIYQHIYDESYRDIQILNEYELAKIGFGQKEVKARGGTFSIDYTSCTLMVREFKSEAEAKKILDFIVKENSNINIKIYKNLEEYKNSFKS